ncbi:hypothetical protein TRIP_B120053 [uncultured Desulfatiglans sp.]|nr:hypothetical protein TRIP_B120053 [uncultured Desulfatiglans sp.]
MQSLVIRQNEKQPSSEHFFCFGGAMTVRNKKVVVRWNIFFFNLTKPFQSFDVAHRHYEIVNGTDCFEHYDLFRDYP